MESDLNKETKFILLIISIWSIIMLFDITLTLASFIIIVAILAMLFIYYGITPDPIMAIFASVITVLVIDDVSLGDVGVLELILAFLSFVILIFMTVYLRLEKKVDNIYDTVIETKVKSDLLTGLFEGKEPREIFEEMDKTLREFEILEKEKGILRRLKRRFKR